MEKRKVFFFLATLLINVLIIIYLLVISIPDNPIVFRYKLHFNKDINALIPEGWAFFTRDCKEEQIFLYKITNNSIEPVTLKTSNADQLFGINRHNRIMHSKLSTILSSIKEPYYYKNSIPINKIKLTEINEFNVQIVNSKICGKYLIKLQKPLSWTWFSAEVTIPKSPYRNDYNKF